MPEATKIVYKGPDQDFIVFANPGMVSRWRKDKTIPLVDVVQCKTFIPDARKKKIFNVRLTAFDVMTTTTGSETGEFMRPSKGILE